MGKATFGSSYQEVCKIEVLRNRDSSLACFLRLYECVVEDL